jgi:hypothetical protein
MYGRTTYKDNKLFLNNQEISGVIGFDGNLEIPINYVNFLGSYNGAEEKEGQDTKNITITKYLTPNDIIRNFTGDAFCNGILMYKDQNYSFNSGFLTNYSVSCSAGEISIVTADFDVYGVIGGSILPSFQSNYQEVENLHVSHFGNIHITTNEGTTNRIVSFDLEITCNRVPLFGLGSQYPLDVTLNKPVEINLNIGVEVDDYECNKIQTILCSPKKDIILELKNCDNTITMESFTLKNARLISENIALDLENPTTVNLNYRSYLI